MNTNPFLYSQSLTRQLFWLAWLEYFAAALNLHFYMANGSWFSLGLFVFAICYFALILLHWAKRRRKLLFDLERFREFRRLRFRVAVRLRESGLASLPPFKIPRL